jgi:predicted nucleotidyltransferase
VLIRTLDEVARGLTIRYFVIGATARDIVMEHVHGLDTARATRDIDFAVAVSSWDEFDQLKTRLTATGQFFATATTHRLTFGEERGAYPLDLVPFDGVEKDGAIAWPPKGDFVMNVAGYADAYRSALDIEIEPGFQVKILSLPAMAVLKILAWNDRPDRDKHPSDVLLILRSYHQAGQENRLYAEAIDLLERYGYDIELAGAALLGRDAGRDIVQDARLQVMRVLANDRNADKFIAQMTRSHPAPVEHATRLLQAFLDNIA